MTTVTDFTGILYVSEGDTDITWNGNVGHPAPVIVTYSFVETADIGPWDASAPYSNDGYTSMTAAQRANFEDVLALYEQAAGIIFVEVDSGTAMINAMSTSGSPYGGWANVPFTNAGYTSTGELVVDSAGSFDEGSYAFLTMMHELGHAMGLQHPWEGDIALDPTIDNEAHTVMTYNSNWPYAEELGTLDVAAMQYLYGAASVVAGWVTSFAAGVLTVTASGRADTVLGAAGQNVLNGAGGSDHIYGRQDADKLFGGLGGDTLAGGGGADSLNGGAGDDLIYATDADGSWDDTNVTLIGAAGSDTLIGAYGRDSLFGGAGADDLNGQSGHDAVHGGAGNDHVAGDAPGVYGGNDTLYGDGGRDVLEGGQGTDVVYGGAGGDTLNGGAGWDSLFGGDGDDVLTGGGTGSVVDYFTGDAGADIFVFTAADDGSNMYITDFARGEDRIDVSDLAVGFADVWVSGSWAIIGNLYINTSVAAQLTAGDFIF
jgi:serralysin